MLDLKFVRENPDIVKQNIKNKFQDSKLPLVDEVIALDAENRTTQKEADDLRASRNKLSKQIGALMGQGKKEEAEEVKKQLVAEDEITKQAQAQAADILSDAKKKSSEMKKAANGYVTDLMKRADETLTDLTNEIRKTRQDIQAQKKD